MKISSDVLARAKDFLYHNGRLIDRRRFEFFWGNGSAESVLDVLRGYQNEDGGFGNALESDIRCPDSQPVATEVALQIMDSVGVYDANILDGILRYLESITVKETGGFPRAISTLNAYPHAPWWTTEVDGIASLNPTGSIVSYLYKQRVRTDFYDADWFKQTIAFLWQHMDQVNTQDFHDVIQCINFLTHTPEHEQKAAYIDRIDGWLSNPSLIERDPKAEGYVHKVLDWAPAADSYCTKFISQQDIELHLEYLLQEQQADGGWTISWPVVSDACLLDWRGWITVERLLTLKSYGLL